MLHWLQHSSDCIDDVAVVVTRDFAVRYNKLLSTVHSVSCEGTVEQPLKGEPAPCAPCRGVWSHPRTALDGPACKTTGSTRTRFNNRLCGEARRWRTPVVVTALQKRSAKRAVANARGALQRAKRTLDKQLATDEALPPTLLALIKVLRARGASGKLTQCELETLLENITNMGRTGKEVHGRRYRRQHHIAVSAHFCLRQQTRLRQIVTENMGAALPHSRTVNRRCFNMPRRWGLQALETLQLARPLFPSPFFHCCFDEVAVNQKITCLACDDGHEVEGYANRCDTQRHGDGQRIVLRDGALFVNGAQKDVSKLTEVTAAQPRATQVCAWMLFVPERSSPVRMVRAVPTDGTLTYVDDLAACHEIVTRSAAAGILIRAFGGDHAHSKFFRALSR